MNAWDVQSLGRRVLAAIPTGKRNAKSSDCICREAGVPEEFRSQRPTRDIIIELLRSQEPILSCSRGYFLATTADEIHEYVGSLYSRQGGIQERVDLVLAAAKAKGLI